MKPILRPILKFFLAFLLIYGVLVGASLVPQVGFFCNAIYQKTASPILRATLSKAHIQLRLDETNPDIIWEEFASRQKVGEQMAQASREGKKNASINGDRSKAQFYNLFLSFWLLFLALMLVSPIAWKAKIWKIILGSLVFYSYSVLKLWLQLMSHFNLPEIGIYHLGENALGLVRSTLSVMTLGLNLLVVLVLWAVLAFDKNNWRGFMEKIPLQR